MATNRTTNRIAPVNPTLAIALIIHPMCMTEAKRLKLDDAQALCMWLHIVADMCPTMLADNTMNIVSWSGSVVNLSDGSEETEDTVGRVAIGWIRARWTMPGASRERLPRPDVMQH